MRLVRISLFCFAALGIAGCASPGPVDNPIGRTLSWFSYVGGEDLRDACVPGTPERYRFVYNGLYNEQVRSYDVGADVVGEGAILQSRVHGPPGLASFDLRAPLESWQGQFDQRLLSREQWDTLRQSVTESGFFEPPPAGDFLRSDAFYWAVSACRQGEFHFNAWQQPGSDLGELSFPAVLFALDRTGVAVNPPRQVTLGPFGGSPDVENRDNHFRLQVGRNGLVIGPRW